jgi:hypothetical protein
MVNPSQVPAMVAAHQDALRTVFYEDFAGYFMRSVYAKDNDNQHYDEIAESMGRSTFEVSMTAGRDWVRQERDMLNISALFHVTEPMMSVAGHAAEKLDDNERWSPEILPSANGFMVFEKPLHVADIWGRMTSMAAVSWRRDSIANDIDPTLPFGTLFSFYTDSSDMSDAYNMSLALEDGHIRQLGRFVFAHYGSGFDGAPIGPMMHPDGTESLRKYRERNAEIDAQLHKDSPAMALTHRILHPEDYDADGNPLGPDTPIPDKLTNSVNVFRTVYAIFALMQQTVATLTEETDRKLARRIKNKRRPPPMVTVIRLRHPEQFGRHDEGTGSWLTYRSITRAHWRRQHYGDGSVKRIFINAYWRGPENAPVYQPARVTSLQR